MGVCMRRLKEDGNMASRMHKERIQASHLEPYNTYTPYNPHKQNSIQPPIERVYETVYLATNRSLDIDKGKSTNGRVGPRLRRDILCAFGFNTKKHLLTACHTAAYLHINSSSICYKTPKSYIS